VKFCAGTLIKKGVTAPAFCPGFPSYARCINDTQTIVSQRLLRPHELSAIIPGKTKRPLAVERALRRDTSPKPENKYICPYGDNRHLYFPPGAASLLADPTVPVVFVEVRALLLGLRQE
jgi:hypothetical protein